MKTKDKIDICNVPLQDVYIENMFAILSIQVHYLYRLIQFEP